MEKVIHSLTVPVPRPRLLRVAAYARVSSGKDAMLHSLSRQISYYSQMIQKHPGWTYAGCYADADYTGTRGERPEFQRLLADCRAGKIDRILTKSVSRFARNTVTLLETARELKERGIAVFFEKERLDTLSGDGELMLSFLASFAQEESRSVSENCKWRVRKDFSEGRPMNLMLLYGYRSQGGRIVIDPEEASVVRRVFHDYTHGLGSNLIAEALQREQIPCRLGGRWSSGLIRTMLANEKYMGDALLQKTFCSDHLTKKKVVNRGQLPQYYVQDSHPAIIERETWALARQTLQANREKTNVQKPTTARYPFSGRIVCGCFGQHYRRRTNVSRITWQCRTYLQRGKAFCPAKQIPEETLYRITEEALGVKEITEESLTVLKEIRVPKDNHLVFVFQDGREAERVWKDRSRAESWTEEMREQARLHNLKRKKGGNQG